MTPIEKLLLEPLFNPILTDKRHNSSMTINQNILQNEYRSLRKRIQGWKRGNSDTKTVTFLYHFRFLESIYTRLAKYITRNQKLTLEQCIRIFEDRSIVDKESIVDLDRLRKLRNELVHSIGSIIPESQMRAEISIHQQTLFQVLTNFKSLYLNKV